MRGGCRDPGSEVVGCAGSVAFEAQEVFAGHEDRFDPLPDRRQADARVGLVLASWSHDQAAELADGVFELLAGVALVADDRFAAGERPRQQGQGDFALRAIRGDQWP